MALAMPREERHIAPLQFSQQKHLARIPEWRLNLLFTNVGQPFHSIQPAAADNPNLRLRQTPLPKPAKSRAGTMVSISLISQLPSAIAEGCLESLAETTAHIIARNYRPAEASRYPRRDYSFLVPHWRYGDSDSRGSTRGPDARSIRLLRQTQS